MSELSIYERLRVMSVSAARVTDDRTIPGVVAHELPSKQWAVVDGTAAGCLMMFVRPRSLPVPFARNRYRDTVVVTRFIFDHGVDVADLIDHAYVDARALDGWQEESTQRWPIGTRHSGWAQQAGTYTANGESLFMTTTHVVHDRGNVGYLIQQQPPFVPPASKLRPKPSWSRSPRPCSWWIEADMVLRHNKIDDLEAVLATRIDFIDDSDDTGWVVGACGAGHVYLRMGDFPAEEAWSLWLGDGRWMDFSDLPANWIARTTGGWPESARPRLPRGEFHE